MAIVFDALGNPIGEIDNSPATVAAQNKQKAPSKANNAPKPTSTTSVGTGLIAALNNYQQQQVKLKKYNVADIYEIKFADEILASATVTPPGGLDKALTGSAVGATAADQKLPEKQNMDASTRIRSATAGQQIIQFIDQVLRASSYILDQSAVIWNEKTNTWELNGKPASQFAWFNIVCNAEQLNYDDKRNDHAYRMTFVVTPYQVPVQSEYFKPGKFRGVHKVYNYWFTGQNSQVLQYEQHFNKLWTQAITGTNLPQNIQQQVNSVSTRHIQPDGHGAFDFVWTHFGFEDDTPEMHERRLRQANLFGPAGFVSADDGEVIEFSQQAFETKPEHRMLVELGGRDVGETDHMVTETLIRGMYEYWRKVMEA